MTLVENQTPIKERLLAEIRKEADHRGRLRLPIHTLGKRFGLNNHDLQKNLFQLEKEGLLQIDEQHGAGPDIKRVRLRRGAANEQLLKSKRDEKLTIPARVRQLIENAPKQQDGWLYVTPTQIRDRLGVQGNPVSVAISDMQRNELLEVRKEGARIVAVRMTPKTATAARPTPGATPEAIRAATPSVQPRPTVELPATPHLEKYIAARRTASLAPEDNPYIEVTFHRDPLAEEAALLRAALLNCMGQPENRS